MKFIVSSSYLLKELTNIAGVVGSSTALPILECFLFEVNKKKLTVTATDLETTMVSTLDLEKAEKNGRIAVPARTLLDALKLFAEQPLSFNVDESSFIIEVATDNGKYKFSGVNPEDYPRLPELENAAQATADADVFFAAISKTFFAAGNDDLRPVMSGVYFELNEDNMTFVATDAHKLVRYTRKGTGVSKAASFIMPRKPSNLLKSMLSAADGEVTLEYNGTNAHFSLGHLRLICRLIDGKYPNYDAVIPKSNENHITVDRQQFVASVKRVSIFSNKSTHQVRLKIAGNELTVMAEDLDFSNEAVERLTCNHNGEDIEIGFNSRYLLEMLGNVESEFVQLELSEPNKAGLLVPAEGNDGDEQLLMLIMPVMLNN
ncbi:MAG: DNA polymerase III subunit beta [Flavobacteriales bacterium]|jgi:DNA polymerase-3 subunit beta|nr:DNA polymerase III subunit beta [Flavobacteriales bacterium]